MAKHPMPESAATPPGWAIEIEGLLTRAAELCIEHDVDPSSFMRGAWAAYVESRPDLREHLEDLELRQQLAALRAHGAIGQA